MDSIAVISDIHGNLTAFQTVLSDIRKRGITSIICLGDVIGKGHHQEECLALAKETCSVLLMGNHEEYHEPKVELPFCHELYLSGRLVRFFHAHPASTKFLIFGSFMDPKAAVGFFEPSERTVSQKLADVAVLGHTHAPCMNKCYHRILLNAGSVGNWIECFSEEEKNGDPRATAKASYLILSGILDSHDFDDPLSFEFVNLSYDIDKELEGIDDPAWEEELRKGWYRDQPKLKRYFEQKKG